MTRVGSSRWGKTAAQKRAQAAVNKKYGAGHGNLKRTTRRGAYNSNRKKAIGIRLRPMVETKKWKDSDLALIITTAAGNYGQYSDPRTLQDCEASMANISPMCCNFGFNTIDGSGFIGDNRYHRLLSQKVGFVFPQGENIPMVAQEAWLVHGWITEPINVSSITSGAVQPEDVNPAFYTQFITEQVKEYFNQRQDQLDWVPKGRSNIKVLGKKLIRPRSNNRAWSSANVAMGAGLDGYPSDGAVIPDSPIYNLTWKINRKAQMYDGPAFPAAALVPDQLLFERGNWIPFSIVFQPHFEDQYPASASRLKVQSDSQLYYTDM